MTTRLPAPLPDVSVTPLSATRLHQMIEIALSQPQVSAPLPVGRAAPTQGQVVRFPLARRVTTLTMGRAAAIGGGGFALAASLLLAVSLFTPGTQSPIAVPSARLSNVALTPDTALPDVADMITYDVFANAI